MKFYYDMPYFITITTLFGAVSNVILNKLVIPQFGFTAAGSTTAIRYLTVFAMHCLVYIYIKNEKMEGQNCFNMFF